jgi:prepilin-type N-terminal cleavage/methylation domain-containing protein
MVTNFSKQTRKGTTMVELMIVVAILGVVGLVAPRLVINTSRFFTMNNARVDLQRDARNAMSIMNRNLRQAQAATLVIDQISGQPYYSRLTFTKIDGKIISYFQDGDELMMVVNGNTNRLSDNLRYLAFALPKSDDLGIISVSVTFEKSIFEGRKKALHMASERVRVMN